MNTYASIKNRLRHTVRLDRAIRFVRQAGPVWFICSSILVLLQGAIAYRAVLVSHRFSTVKMADRIVALKNGQIVEQGTHSQLLQKKGYHAHLFEKQADCFR